MAEGDDVTAGCRVSNRHCSVGKLALSARGHPAGHREVFDELNSTRWLPLIQLGLPGWQFERKKGFRKPPKGLKNAIEPSKESAERTVMRSKTCWMYGEGWLFDYWWPSENVKTVTQAQWICLGAKCTVQTVEREPLVCFFSLSATAFLLTPRCSGISARFLNCQPWAPYGFALAVVDPHHDITQPRMHNSCPS